MPDNGTAQKSKLVSQVITPEQLYDSSNLEEIKDNIDEVLTLAPSYLTTSQQVEKQQYYSLMKFRDAQIDACLEFRIATAMRTPWQVIYNTKDPQSEELGELVNKVLYELIGSQNIDDLNFEQSMRFLLDAIYKGFSAIECDYQIIENKILPINLRSIDQINLAFDNKNQLRWITKKGDSSMNGTLLYRDKFILHRKNLTQDNPYGVSVLGSAVFWSFYFKKVIMNLWNQYCERFSKPIPYGKVPSDWSAEEKNTFLSQLQEIWKKRAIVSTDRTALEFLEPSGTGSESLRQYLDYLDKQIAMKILGQSNTSSSESEGSFARDKVARGISDDIVRSDVLELQNTINRWITYWVRLNYPSAIDIPYIQFDISEKEDKTQLIENLGKLADRGVGVPVWFIREKIGIPTPDDDDELLGTSASNNPFPTLPDIPTDTDPNNKSDDNNTDIDDAVEDALDEDFEYNTKTKMKEFSLTKYASGGSVKKVWETVSKWQQQSIQNISKSIKPFLNQLKNHIKKIENREQIFDIKPDPKVLQKLSEEYFNGLFWTYLYGQWYQKKKTFTALHNTNDKNVLLFAVQDTLFPDIQMPFDEAIEFFKDKIPTLLEDLPELESGLRSRAFWLGRNNTWQAVNETYRLLQEAIDLGVPFDEWLLQNENLFDRLGFSTSNPYYLENVYRTNTNGSFNAGQYRQLTNPVVESTLTYWKYVAVGDARTRPEHMAMNGYIARNDDPIWDIWYPPNGYMCRCQVIALSNRMMRRLNERASRRVPTINGDPVQPDKGFRRNESADWITTAPPNTNNMPENWGSGG